MPETLRIGSRGSRLALVQSEWVRDQLLALHPGLVVEIEVIQTTGDKLLDAPLAKIGDKGLFVKELESAMLDGRTDLAVHSAKDMPTEVPADLDLLAFTKREDVHDVFVAHEETEPATLAEVTGGAVIGSSSLRRRSQLLALRPDLELVDIRGNVETRLRKVGEQGMAGTVLAAAGLARLGRAGLAAFRFSFDEMLPAVGQGALAIEGRADDERVRALVAPLNDPASACTVRAERALMSALQGGCQVPIAGYAEAIDGRGSRGADLARTARQPNVTEGLRLRAFVGSLDGADTVRREAAGSAEDPEALGVELAAQLVDAGAGRILAVVRGAL